MLYRLFFFIFNILIYHLCSITSPQKPVTQFCNSFYLIYNMTYLIKKIKQLFDISINNKTFDKEISNNHVEVIDKLLMI